MPGDEVDGVFKEDSCRLAAGVALNLPARRVGRGGGDAGQAQGQAVGPGRVAALVGQQGGAVGHDGVQFGGGGEGVVGPGGDAPAPAAQPARGLGLPRRERAYLLQDRLPRR